MLPIFAFAPTAQHSDWWKSEAVRIYDIATFFRDRGYAFRPDDRGEVRGTLTRDGRSMRVEIDLFQGGSNRSAAGPQSFIGRLRLSVDLDVSDGDAEAAVRERGPLRLPWPGVAFVAHPGHRVTAFADFIAPPRPIDARSYDEMGGYGIERPAIPTGGELATWLNRFQFSTDAFVRRHRGRFVGDGRVDWTGARFPEATVFALEDGTAVARLVQAWGWRASADPIAVDPFGSLRGTDLAGDIFTVAGERLRLQVALPTISALPPGSTVNGFPKLALGGRITPGTPLFAPREFVLRGDFEAPAKVASRDWTDWLDRRVRAETPPLRIVFSFHSLETPVEHPDAMTVGAFHKQVLRFADALNRIRADADRPAPASRDRRTHA